MKATPAAVHPLGAFLLPLGAVLCLFPVVSTGEGLLLGLALALAFGNPYLDL